MKKNSTLKTVLFAVGAVIWLIPALLAVMNSFKTNEAVSTVFFSPPFAQAFSGAENYKTALTFGNYPFLRSFGYSVVISVLSTALIVLCCSMAAWYIVRVDSGFTKRAAFFYLNHLI